MGKRLKRFFQYILISVYSIWLFFTGQIQKSLEVENDLAQQRKDICL